MGASFIPGNGPASAVGGDDAYKGGSARLTLDWGAMTSSRPKPPPAPGRHRAPKVKIEVPGRQDVLGQGHLNVRVLCGEPCAAEAHPGRPAGGRPDRPRRRSLRGRSADLTLELSAARRTSLREQLAAGKTVVFEAKATARDAPATRPRPLAAWA